MRSKNEALARFLVFFVLLLVLVKPANSVTLPFEDGFENIAVGDYPNENGWRNLFSGRSAYVSDEVAHNGSRSFRLESYSSWARTDYVSIPEIPDILSCEVSVLPDPNPARPVYVGFVESIGNLNPSYNKFRIYTSDGSIGSVHFDAGYGLPSVELGNFNVGDWITVKADYDFTNQVVDLWLNGQLLATDVSIVPREFYDADPRYRRNIILSQWGVMEGNWGGGGTGVIYIDDVRITSGTITAEVKYGGGRGTAEDPYLIHTAQQMNAIGANSNDWDKHFKLMADIDLSSYSGTDFNIIGYYKNDDDNKPFTGVFDGNGHTISNFSYTVGFFGDHFIGLFGYVGGTDMEIKGLGLIDPNVNAGTKRGVGSLVGLMEYGDITNCYVRNGNVSGNTWVGGLAGRTFVNTITDCYVEADVSGFTKIGGLVGVNYAGLIKNCSSSSDVFGTSKIGGLVGVNEFLMEQGFYIPGNITGCCAEGKMEGLNCVGGLVGDNLGRVTDSYATGDVFVLFVFQIDGPPGGNRIGGLVGHNYYWTDALVPPSVLRCYSTGSITESILGTDNVGGLVGLNEGTVTNSFWDVETSGISSSDGGTGRTTSQMQRQSTFINAGWDFINETANGTEDIWCIGEGRDYPRLTWELIEEEPDEVADSLSEAMDTSLSFTTGGNADWFAQTTTSRYDGDAAQSGDISSSQESWMQTTVRGTGTVKFYWKVSSEEDFDFLEFYIDGSLQEKISGLVDWEQKTYPISTSGSHTLEWRYMKDPSGNSGSDCGWVDRVEWVTTS